MVRARRPKSEIEKNRAAALAFVNFWDGFQMRIGIAPEEGAEAKRELKEGGTVEVINPNINVATAARNNEFGSITPTGAEVPARPAFRPMARMQPTKRAIQAFEHELQRHLGNKGSISDKKLTDLATELGQDLAGLLVEQLDFGVPPPNADRTVRDKGFNKPLEATRQTMESVSTQVFVRRKRKLRVFANGSQK